MLEAIVIIIALGGLEIALWWADHSRQAEQLATLEAIWVELAILNEDRGLRDSRHPLENSASKTVDLAMSVGQTPTVVTQ
jgi:hypothetical protein